MSRELLKRIYKTLDLAGWHCEHESEAFKVMELVAAEIANPEPEPFGYISGSSGRIALNGGAWDYVTMSRLKLTPWDIPLYTHAPSKLDPLSNEAIFLICERTDEWTLQEFARAIENAHGIGGMPA